MTYVEHMTFKMRKKLNEICFCLYLNENGMKRFKLTYT